MGRYINPDEPFDEETKDFLRKRARNDEVIENERRFPPDGQAAEHEESGYMPTKVGYDYEKQAQKIEDAGGLEVERIPTDDQGRPMVKEYGYVEGIVKSDDFESEIDDAAIAEDQAKEPESADSDGDDLDDDILERVLDLEYDDLQKELKELGLKANGTKEDLIDRLANALQDKRDEENAK